jgi:hypothetical protein
MCETSCFVGVPEEAFFVKGSQSSWQLCWMIKSELGFGNDFAGAVKEKQGRADNQLFNAWGKFLPAQDQFISWLVPRLTGIIGKGWEETPIYLSYDGT